MIGPVDDDVRGLYQNFMGKIHEPGIRFLTTHFFVK